MFSEQTFLNAGPIIIRSLQGATEAGFIFNVLMLARAPLQLFQSISTSILPHLTRLHTSDEPDSGEREFGHTVRMVLLGVAAFTALVTVVVLIAGPKCMQIAFGKKFTYDRLGLLLVTFGMGLYLSSVTLNQACVAMGQVRRCGRALDHLRGGLHRLELRADRRRRAAPGRGRLPARRRRPLRPALVGLRRTRRKPTRGRPRARLPGGAGGEAGVDRRERLIGRPHPPLVRRAAAPCRSEAAAAQLIAAAISW